MLKVVLILAGCIGVLIVGVLVFAATKPDTFRVTRSASIKAQPDKIFPLIDDFHAWTKWSPYENKDPQMKRTFGATSAGKGAVYEWDGNGQVGSGRITITDTAPPSKVLIDLDMARPIHGAQQCRVHARAAGRRHQGDLGDVRRRALSRQDHARVLQHGQNGWRRFRGRSRQSESRG